MTRRRRHASAILREEWGRGSEFAQKITYRTTGSKPEELIKAFRTSYYPRIAVTVDMIATGTDIKPVEIVVFMRSVKSRNFFEQIKGRAVRLFALRAWQRLRFGAYVCDDLAAFPHEPAHALFETICSNSKLLRVRAARVARQCLETSTWKH